MAQVFAGDCFDIQIEVDSYEVKHPRLHLLYEDELAQQFGWQWFTKSKTICALHRGRPMVEEMSIFEPHPITNPPTPPSGTVEFLIMGRFSWHGDGDYGRWNVDYKILGRAVKHHLPARFLYDGALQLWGSHNLLNALAERYGAAADIVSTKVSIFQANGDIQSGTCRVGGTTYEMLRARYVPAKFLHFTPCRDFMRNLAHRCPPIIQPATNATSSISWIKR